VTIAVREIQEDDKAGWLVLWQGYQSFYGVTLPVEVSETTWRRFFESHEPLHAHVALDADRIVGIVHYVFHRSTWMIDETCYLQDVFVTATDRGRGTARALINSVYAEADRKGGRQVYWLTHKSNAAARGLYDKIAVNAGFVLYERIDGPN
jgi:GNAT superfamily N-acetyltransferase